MCKVCWVLVVVFFWAAAGSVVASDDGRKAISLLQDERELVLAEMREFLEAVQMIVASAARDDMPAVTIAAKKVGMAAQGGMPGSLRNKLPMGFKKLGMGTHKKFDTLALDAESLADSAHSMQQLAELMQNCISCHNSFKFVVEK